MKLLSAVVIIGLLYLLTWPTIQQLKRKLRRRHRRQRRVSKID